MLHQLIILYPAASLSLTSPPHYMATAGPRSKFDFVEDDASGSYVFELQDANQNIIAVMHFSGANIERMITMEIDDVHYHKLMDRLVAQIDKSRDDIYQWLDNPDDPIIPNPGLN